MNSNLIPPSFTYKDVLLRKLYYSVMCSVLSQLVLLQVYVFISNFNPLHPVEWVLSVFRTFTSLSTWLFVIPFITIIFAQSTICAKDYVFKSSYCSTRFQKFISVISMHNLVLLFLNILVGTNLIWLFLSLGDGQYRNMTYKCKDNNYCLNKGTFFLVVSGIWTGLYYFLKVYISEKHLTFPVIYQRKVLQLKAQILPLLRESFMLSLWPTFYFIGLYYWWGDRLVEDFISTFGFIKEESGYYLIYVQLWMFGAIYYFNMSLMRFFFNLFLTEPIEFPLFKDTPDSLSLQESLNMSDLPILQSLACLDLYNLAQWSTLRRQVFFTLSQPGGHPHNWNSLVENILKLFNEYMDLLNKSSESTEVAKPSTAAVVPQNPLRPSNRFRNLRNMALVTPESDMLDFVEVTHEPLPKITLPEKLMEKLKQKLQNVFNLIKIVLGINFLFGELPQANIQKCLANGHVIIWTSQGISDLACVSIVEDRYGIVQKDLPGIITTLVQLKQSLDRLNKVPALARRVAGFDDFNYRMKSAITAAVKRSLFNICRTFGSYLNEFPLNKDIVLYLQTIYKA